MNRSDLIKKVQALRNLAGNSASTIEEAETAARLAEALIQKHFLEEAEFEFANGSQEDISEDGVPITSWNQKQVVWHNILLTALVHSYDCDGVLSYRNGKLGYYAVGRASNVATVRYQFAYFVLELTRLAHLLAPDYLGRGSGKTWHNSFYRGAVSALVASLKTVKQEIRASANSSALAVFDRNAMELKRFMQQKYANQRVVSKPLNTHDPNAYRLGQQAASGLQSKPGLNAGYRGLLSK